MYIRRWTNRNYEYLTYNAKLSDLKKKFEDISEDIVLILRDEDRTLFSAVWREDCKDFQECDPNRQLKEVLDPAEFFLFDDDILEDAIFMMLKNKLKILPVVDYQMKVLGTFGVFELMKAFVDVTAMDEAGTKIMLTLPDRPGELKRVIEILSSKGFNILSLITSRTENKDRRIVSIKVDLKNVEMISDILDNENIDYEGIYEEGEEIE